VESSQSLVDGYLARAMEEFDSNHLSARLIRRLAEEFPGFFLIAAQPYLNSTEQSNALRFLATLALRQEGMFEYLTSPDASSRDNAVNLFKRFLEIDPSFDVRLAERLPNRRESNLSDALDSMRSTRALDILDQTSRGRRLLPIVGHLPTYRDTRISAKATLFVGRRIQNPSWTKKQLVQPDQRVRANALESLWGLDSPAAVNLLEDCSDDVNNRVLGNSLLGLHLLGKAEVERRVLVLADAGKHEFRATAAWIMGKMSGEECVHRLTALVRDDHPQVRSTALRSLIEIRRAVSRTPQAIADRAAKADAEAAAKAVQKALEAIKVESVEKQLDVRLDGASFGAAVTVVGRRGR
jgi:HEAT repeat protein